MFTLTAEALFGLTLSALLGFKQFPFRGLIISILNTFRGLPPVVVGLFRRSFAFPIVALLSHLAIASVDPIIAQAAETLGVNLLKSPKKSHERPGMEYFQP